MGHTKASITANVGISFSTGTADTEAFRPTTRSTTATITIAETTKTTVRGVNGVDDDDTLRVAELDLSTTSLTKHVQR